MSFFLMIQSLQERSKSWAFFLLNEELQRNYKLRQIVSHIETSGRKCFAAYWTFRLSLKIFTVNNPSYFYFMIHKNFWQKLDMWYLKIGMIRRRSKFKLKFTLQSYWMGSFLTHFQLNTQPNLIIIHYWTRIEFQPRVASYADAVTVNRRYTLNYMNMAISSTQFIHW